MPAIAPPAKMNPHIADAIPPIHKGVRLRNSRTINQSAVTNMMDPATAIKKRHAMSAPLIADHSRNSKPPIIPYIAPNTSRSGVRAIAPIRRPSGGVAATACMRLRLASECVGWSRESRKTHCAFPISGINCCRQAKTSPQSAGKQSPHPSKSGLGGLLATSYFLFWAKPTRLPPGSRTQISVAP